ncbi:MAG: ATP phosphoribosyltransferase regulatory subunit [Proteobacteria bacterium]|nr:ATP phosphoribosyltransferase regulatory subunit [Pseudomonadota bacterium]
MSVPLTVPNRQAELMALFQRHGFAPSDVPILQPAEPFIELSGEEIRRRLFLVSEGTDEETCLRPEFTIPAARAVIAHGGAPRADLAFVGPVFRQRADAAGEFVQAGLESFGRTDVAAADADMLALALETEALLGGRLLAIRIGDVGLLSAVIAALELPAALARRLRQTGLNSIGRPVTAPESNGLAGYRGVLSALKGADPAEARAFVKDLLSIAGLKAVGGRTPAEIADRFLEKAEDGGAGLSPRQEEVLRQFAAIAGSPAEVAAGIRALAKSHGVDLHAAIDRFEARNAAFVARGLNLDRFEVSTAFARNLDYYTGFVFEFIAPGRDRPAIAGGRYDGLLRRLGAADDCPAVGCAIWLERFED